MIALGSIGTNGPTARPTPRAQFREKRAAVFRPQLPKDKYFERIGGSIEAEPLQAQVQSVF
jgi:hypothetical protein